jgi:hypothetical protein
VHVGKRMRLNFIRVKNLLDAFHPNKGFHTRYAPVL